MLYPAPVVRSVKRTMDDGVEPFLVWSRKPLEEAVAHLHGDFLLHFFLKKKALENYIHILGNC